VSKLGPVDRQSDVSHKLLDFPLSKNQFIAMLCMSGMCMKAASECVKTVICTGNG
jgi:hypothetical protein